MTDGASRAHLLGRVGVVEERIRLLVAERRAEDPQPDDPFRGLYLSEEAVDRLLGTVPGTPRPVVPSSRLEACERAADRAQEEGHRLRLRELAAVLGLSVLDVDLLLVALAADLDPRFEQLFGYLNDDVTRRRPSAAVALTLCGAALSDAGARARLLSGPLVTGDL
ncbi:MAG: ATP-binding protein, partial [Actinomycetota bacterium]